MAGQKTPLLFLHLENQDLGNDLWKFQESEIHAHQRRAVTNYFSVHIVLRHVSDIAL